jgi:hypothetical protein
MIKMPRKKFNEYLARGKAISIQGENSIVLDNGDIEVVKITGQINYKGEKPNSFTPVKIEGI